MMKGRDMIDHWYLKHGRACVSLVLLLAPLPLQLPAAPVRVIETEESFRVVDEGGGNPRKMRLRQVRLELPFQLAPCPGLTKARARQVNSPQILTNPGNAA